MKVVGRFIVKNIGHISRALEIQGVPKKCGLAFQACLGYLEASNQKRLEV